MKNLITVLFLSVGLLGFSQNVKGSAEKVNFEEIKITNVKIEVTVDNAKELESTFNEQDLKEILEKSESGEGVIFKLTCNGKTMSNGTKSHVSYTIDGNTDNIDQFLAGVSKIKTAAFNYYNNKN